MNDASYAFGDTDVAAQRLRLVAELFAPEIRSFLVRAVRDRPRLALDLGCGPGYATRLLAAVLQPDLTIGLDLSKRYLRMARTRFVPGVEFAQRDVTVAPFPVAGADVMLCRLVLAHLRNPASVLQTWVAQLRPGGLLLVDEVARIRCEQPVLRRYMDVVEALIQNRGGQLYIGASLDDMPPAPGLLKRSSEVTTFGLRTGDAATMFRMNLEVWRYSQFVRTNYSAETIETLAGELDDIAQSPAEEEVVWSFQQMVFERINSD